MNERGASVDDYQAPLFFAWQLTNRCTASCLHCCEESGPDKAWKDELTKNEALKLAREIVEAGIPYAAFAGGEPLGVPHAWEVFEILHKGGVELKLETNGQDITEEKADFLKSIEVQCVQISIDGASAAVYDRVRVGGKFDAAVEAVKRLAKRGIPPEFCFVPTKYNLGDIAEAYHLAAELGCRAFVTGPMMRIGRAAQAWETLNPSEDDWKKAVEAVETRAARLGNPIRLAIYPWDILTEMKKRLESPQALLLVVPNGKAKLLNALPFSPGSLREQSIPEVWEAYKKAWKSQEVADYIKAIETDPSLFLNANRAWPMGYWAGTRKPA